MKYRQYPKRNAIRNYFPLPNEIFMLGLCAGEISVYSYLLYLENRKTFQCWPSERSPLVCFTFLTLSALRWRRLSSLNS